jgi:hypothetical protein
MRFIFDFPASDAGRSSRYLLLLSASSNSDSSSEDIAGRHAEQRRLGGAGIRRSIAARLAKISRATAAAAGSSPGSRPDSSKSSARKIEGETAGVVSVTALLQFRCAPCVNDRQTWEGTSMCHWATSLGRGSGYAPVPNLCV